MDTPEIKLCPTRKLLGRSLEMSLAKDRTIELWTSFMPRKKEIKNIVGHDLYSMQVYNPNIPFSSFNEYTEYTKWAVVEVSSFENIPTELYSYELLGGLYAVFIHKGLASDFAKTANYIFRDWLPNSNYHLDNREHFEVLGKKYKRNDPSSEEEVWIPVKSK